MYSYYARGWGIHSELPVEWDKDDPREMAFVADKGLSIRTHKAYMLSRLLQMFEYKNLPETIPAEMLELQLILNGCSFITEVNGNLYALVGSPGGEPDPYYRPTKYVWANPALNASREDDLWTGGILMRNDKLWMGLSPLMDKYAAILAENEITIRVADIMLRVVALISSPDDSTKVAADLYIKKLLNGKLSTVGENRFFDGIRMQSPPSNNGSYLTQFIELQQYMKASFYNEVGMQANYNMKRENIGAGETSMNQNATLPLCDQMLATRREDLSRLNEMYGLDVSVDFTSAWKLNAEELKLEVEQLKAELAATKMTQGKSTYSEDGGGSDGQEEASEGQEGQEQAGEGQKGDDSGSDENTNHEEGTKDESSDVGESSEDSSEDGEGSERDSSTSDEENRGDRDSDEVVGDEEGDSPDVSVVVEINQVVGDEATGSISESGEEVSQLAEEDEEEEGDDDGDDEDA